MNILRKQIIIMFIMPWDFTLFLLLLFIYLLNQKLWEEHITSLGCKLAVQQRLTQERLLYLSIFCFSFSSLFLSLQGKITT